MDYEQLVRDLGAIKQGHPLAALGSEHSDFFKQLLTDSKTNASAKEALHILIILRENMADTKPRTPSPSDSFKSVVAEGVKLQKRLPWLDLVAVGGTASALHAGHRVSYDVDFVTRDLSKNFEEVLQRITEWSEWTTNRTDAPFIILGEANEIELGIRQAFRTKPFSTIEKEGLRIPTLGECFKIKAYMVGKRRATRDFVDTCALLDLIPEKLAVEFLDEMDRDFPPVDKLSNTAKLAESIRRGPKDLDKVNLNKFKGLVAPYNDWKYIDQRLKSVTLNLTKAKLENIRKTPTLDERTT
jgi:hypothetical protein